LSLKTELSEYLTISVAIDFPVSAQFELWVSECPKFEWKNVLARFVV
jgi:hypothetical protein